jgi:two-component system NtrC family sensor kinase
VASTLSFRLFLGLSVSILLFFSTYAAVCGFFQRRVLEQQVMADASRASDIIRQSLFTSMLRNERERTYTMIRLMGSEPGVEAIRIYNKQGEVMFSSDGQEIGRVIDEQAEACYACHASAQPLDAMPAEDRTRIYDTDEGYRVLGVTNPIANDPSCSSAECHAHDPGQSFLGVLDVQMSLAALDRSVASSRARAYSIAVSIIVLSMLVMAVIVYRSVYTPIRKLREGTQALAGGDLRVEIDIERTDELGSLAKSFNQMARSLRRADGELRAWSQNLENRVKEKTTELEEIHQQMVQVEKRASLGKMAATVAHELNNPLSGILTYAKLVRRRLDRLLPEGSEKQQLLENLELIQSESRRCGGIVRDLLTYAREARPEFKQVHLHDLVEKAAKLVGHHSTLGNVRINLRLQLQDDSLICDADQIVQVMVALMINAVEAMPDGGVLSVETKQAGPADTDPVRLVVADTGIGIPEDDRSRIFDPFFSTKSDTKGVGLGLSVAYGIVQHHEGTISVDSLPNTGTTFTIEIPRDPEAAVANRKATNHQDVLSES